MRTKTKQKLKKKKDKCSIVSFTLSECVEFAGLEPSTIMLTEVEL